jgi:glycerophosphoryl diester phosphodiesterase
LNILESILNNIVSWIFALWPQPRPTNEQLAATKIVAHRGVHENNIATENTMRAFQLAAENNIWGIELDLHFTSDNIPVVIHDPDAGRVFQRPDIIIANCTASEIKTQIPELPLFSEVLNAFAGRLHLMIEVKEDLLQNASAQQNLKSLLAPLTPVKDYHLLSLNPDLLEPLKFAPKAAYLDVMWLNPSYTLRKNHDLGHGAIAGHFLFFTIRVIQQLRIHNKSFGVGFLDSRNSLYREVHRGADFIFTNHPLSLKKYLQS